MRHLCEGTLVNTALLMSANWFGHPFSCPLVTRVSRQLILFLFKFIAYRQKAHMVGVPEFKWMEKYQHMIGRKSFINTGRVLSHDFNTIINSTKSVDNLWKGLQSWAKVLRHFRKNTANSCIPPSTPNAKLI